MDCGRAGWYRSSATFPMTTSGAFLSSKFRRVLMSPHVAQSNRFAAGEMGWCFRCSRAPGAQARPRAHAARAALRDAWTRTALLASLSRAAHHTGSRRSAWHRVLWCLVSRVRLTELWSGPTGAPTGRGNGRQRMALAGQAADVCLDVFAVVTTNLQALAARHTRKSIGDDCVPGLSV